MRTTTLGASGPEVGVIGLGCMGMTHEYDMDTPRDETEMIAVIREAIDSGATLIDTADVYGPHTNELLVGKALAGGYRERAVLATKVGAVQQGEGHQLPGIPVWVDGSPEHIRASIDASLGRLGVDHVDLYQLHRVDPEVPIEESWGALAEIVQAGKASHIGLSKVTVDQIQRAHAIHPVTSVQSELSLWARDPLTDVVNYCQANGIAFLPFSPLGNGVLTGRFASRDDFPSNDLRRLLPRYQEQSIATSLVLVEKVKAIATRIGATPAQVALAWLLAQGNHIIPIPGTKTPRYLRENLAAADLHLTADVLADLNSLTI